jgi:hypothetical protein
VARHWLHRYCKHIYIVPYDHDKDGTFNEAFNLHRRSMFTVNFSNGRFAIHKIIYAHTTNYTSPTFALFYHLKKATDLWCEKNKGMFHRNISAQCCLWIFLVGLIVSAHPLYNFQSIAICYTGTLFNLTEYK